MKMLNAASCRRLAVSALVVAAALGAAATATAQSRTVHGVVLRGGSQVPLAFSIISVTGTSVERFADDSGRFVIGDLPRDGATLRIRHIGYAPVDVPVTGDSMRVELRPIAVSLAAVHVEADRRCIVPSHPDPLATDAASVVINQLVENARQYELLTTKYPFNARMDQRYGYLEPAGAGEVIAERLDVIRSDRVWHYRAGGVIERTSRGNQVNVPTIAVFAQDEFLRRHCFWPQPLSSDTAASLTIEFRVDEKISDPDLNGVIYLDPKTFMMRRAVLQLANLARYGDEFDSVTVETTFSELYPGVPIVTGIDGFDHYAKPRTRDGKTQLAFLERQRVVSIEFAKGPPGDVPNRKRGKTQLILDRVIGVFDATTGKPISDAIVFDTLSKQETRTSGLGIARLAFVLSDRAVIKVSAPGFTPELLPVELSLMETTPLTVVLRPLAP